MKLRIQDNSLRFRLTRREVVSLVENGRVEGEVRFAPDRALPYAVYSTQAAESISVDYSSAGVCLFLPLQWVRAWAESDQVSMERLGRVHLLVEKDFQCLHGPERRDPDAFANPLAEQHRDA
jgi:hypothetical protein